MKKRPVSLISLALIVVLLGFGVAVYKNSEALKGAFGLSPSSLSFLCPASSGISTIYVKEGATSGGTGTKRKPYSSLAEAQAVLETDATIDRVCFSGALTGSLDLGNALSPALTLSAYTSESSISSAALTVELDDSSDVESLTISNLEFEGGLKLNPDTNLTLNGLRIDGNGGGTALWVGSADTVSISDSEIGIADIGVYTAEGLGLEVGTVTIEDVEFSPAYNTAISANQLDSLSVSNSYFNYSVYGINTADVSSLKIEKNTFIGGVNSLAIFNSPTVHSSLDFQNNFVIGNSDAALMNSGDSEKVSALVRNNSFYDNRLASSLWGSINLGVSMGGTVTTPTQDMVYENNIVYANASQAAFGNTTMSVYMTSDFNLFYGDVALNAAGLSDWQTKTELDTSSLYGDPLFVGTEDLHLSSGISPAVDAGKTLSTVTDDMDGDLRSSGTYDIGADEY